MKINLVRFAQSLHLGRSLDLNSSIAEGQRVMGDPVSLKYFDSNFLSIDFASGYSQLVPWSQVSGVFYEGKATSVNPAVKRVKSGTQAAT